MVTLVILEESRMKSRYKSLYGPLLRDMCVSRECSVQRVSQLICIVAQRDVLTGIASFFLR